MTAESERTIGIPTARNADHIGITVPDLDQAIVFFTDVLGCELLYRVGPWSDATGTFMTEHYNVSPRATFAAAMMRCGPTLNVELVGWKAPGQNMQPPENSNVGATHLAFYVADMDAAVSFLKSQPGVRMLSEPLTVAEGPTQGQRSVYFLTPWGMSMELMTWHAGMPYEQKTSARLFGPTSSWTSE